MNALLHITLAQINPVVGDIAHNTKKIKDVWSAAPASTDLVIFPELSVCGYPAEDLILNTAFVDAAKKAVKALARESKNHVPWIVVGAPHHSRGKTYNALHIIGDGKIQKTIRKHHLANSGVFDEERIFSAGPLPTPIDFKGHKIGFMICQDTWHPGPAESLKNKGAEILISINASPYEFDKYKQRIAVIRARVTETGLPFIYVNQYGGQDDLVFDGSSLVMDEKGTILWQAAEFDECIHAIQYPFSSPPSQEIKESLRTESIYNALRTGLRDYVGKNGFTGVLLGLSGGVDSALTAALAVDALGSENVHAVFMPSKYTSDESAEDARALATNLSIKCDTISIAQQVIAFENELASYFTPQTPDITFQNIQSRIRGVTLMALSNATGKMVLSTGNKSEIATGYATLYGDMCGGYNPLKDVYKTQVYELARWRNAQNAVIPERIITKAPTAELKPDQTDQDTLPPYDVLDAILECLVERDMGVKDTVAQGHDKQAVIKISRMLAISEYKRQQAAPGPKISTRAFTRERRWPMTNGFTKIIEK